MSSSTASSAQPVRSGRGGRITFLRTLYSEWIKITTVPSTVILLAVALAVMVGLAALVAWSAVETARDPAMGAAMGVDDGALRRLAYAVPSSGLPFGQLLIASLAVVVMASEYSTGMIRSSMTAVPARTPVLLAKALVITVISFALGVIAAFSSYLVAQPVLAGEGLDYGLDTAWVLPGILNTGTVLALVAVMGVAIGALLRNTAGGVVTLVGALFVLPTIAELLSGLADWVDEAARFLPSNAGQQLVAVTVGNGQLNQVEGGLVLAAWALVLLAGAVLAVKKRDV